MPYIMEIYSTGLRNGKKEYYIINSIKKVHWKRTALLEYNRRGDIPVTAAHRLEREERSQRTEPFKFSKIL